jgi:hypothetical protein
VEAQQKILNREAMIINHIFHRKRIYKIPSSYSFMTFGNVSGISMFPSEIDLAKKQKKQNKTILILFPCCRLVFGKFY